MNAATVTGFPAVCGRGVIAAGSRFSEIRPSFDSEGHAHTTEIEGCSCMIVDLPALLNAVTIALHADKNGTLKQSSPLEGLQRRQSGQDACQNRIKNLLKS